MVVSISSSVKGNQEYSLIRIAMEDHQPKQGSPRVLQVLEALKQASHELQTHPSPDSADSNSSAINALLELETESDNILSKDPHLSTLSQHLATLKNLVETLKKSKGHHSIRSFLTRCCSTRSLVLTCWSWEAMAMVSSKVSSSNHKMEARWSNIGFMANRDSEAEEDNHFGLLCDDNDDDDQCSSQNNNNNSMDLQLASGPKKKII